MLRGVTFQQFRRLCLSLPESEEVETWGEATFRVKNRIFAMGSQDGGFVSVKASLDDQAGLVEMDPTEIDEAAARNIAAIAEMQAELIASRPTFH